MKGLTLQLDNVIGLVTVNGKTIKGPKQLYDNDDIALCAGSSCQVLLNHVPCFEAEAQDIVRVQSHWPPCLHLDSNCCLDRHHFELFTPAGTLNVDRVMIPTPSLSVTSTTSTVTDPGPVSA